MIQRTLAIIKPDAVMDLSTGKIIDRIEEEGFAILALKKLGLNRIEAETFYGIHRERPFFSELVNFMISGPIVVLILEKEDAMQAWRSLMGDTNPEKAAPGTIRSLYGENIGENAVHGSDSPETARQEIAFFFPDLA